MLYTPPCPVVELAVLTGVLHLGSKVQLNAASHLVRENNSEIAPEQ